MDAAEIFGRLSLGDDYPLLVQIASSYEYIDHVRNSGVIILSRKGLREFSLFEDDCAKLVAEFVKSGVKDNLVLLSNLWHQRLVDENIDGTWVLSRLGRSVQHCSASQVKPGAWTRVAEKDMPHFGLGLTEAAVAKQREALDRAILAHEKVASAFDKQEGGTHYKGLAIQPAEFIEKNKLSFLEGCIVKRICRYRTKPNTGKIDLEKIKHEIDMLIELHYSKTPKIKLHPLWSEDTILKYRYPEEVLDAMRGGRGTGRTTMIALRAMANALESSSGRISVSDHHENGQRNLFNLLNSMCRAVPQYGVTAHMHPGGLRVELVVRPRILGPQRVTALFRMLANAMANPECVIIEPERHSDDEVAPSSTAMASRAVQLSKHLGLKHFHVKDYGIIFENRER